MAASEKSKCFRFFKAFEVVAGICAAIEAFVTPLRGECWCWGLVSSPYSSPAAPEDDEGISSRLSESSSILFNDDNTCNKKYM